MFLRFRFGSTGADLNRVTVLLSLLDKKTVQYGGDSFHLFVGCVQKGGIARCDLAGIDGPFAGNLKDLLVSIHLL